MEFQIGDKVVAIRPVDGWERLKGKFGTVVHISEYSPAIGVEFDEIFAGGHDCNGKCKYGKGRYGTEDTFVLVEVNTPELSLDKDEVVLFDEFLLEYCQK